MPEPIRSRCLAALLGLALALLPIPPLAATEPPAEPAPSAVQTPETAPGLKAYIDPETGELTSRPSPEQVRRLSAAVEEAQELPLDDLVPFLLSGGGTGVFLDGRFHTATVLSVAPDGSFTLHCGHPEHSEATPPAAAEIAPVR